MAGTASWKRPERLDLVVAVALAVFGHLEFCVPSIAPGFEPAGHRGLLPAAALLAALPVAFRRAAPVAAIAATTVAIGLPELLGSSQDAMAPFAALLLEAFSLGALADRMRGAATLIAVVAVLAAGDP